jgi:D-methionine transport system permease protein
LSGLWETLYMTCASTAFAYLLGLPLGVLLVVTRRGHILANPALQSGLGVVVNVLRSVPFLILMIAVIPITRFVMGTTIGSGATVMPLVIAAFPYVARTVESSLLEVDYGVIEAAQAMGASRLQIIRKVILPEATPGLVNGAAIATTNILGYSAMAGAIGGGGLGALAINYGYYRYKTDVLLAAIAVLVLLVQCVQHLGTWVACLVDHRLK